MIFHLKCIDFYSKLSHPTPLVPEQELWMDQFGQMDQFGHVCSGQARMTLKSPQNIIWRCPLKKQSAFKFKIYLFIFQGLYPDFLRDLD